MGKTLISWVYTSPKSKPALELISRAETSVEAHQCSVSPDAGRNSSGRQIIIIIIIIKGLPILCQKRRWQQVPTITWRRGTRSRARSWTADWQPPTRPEEPASFPDSDQSGWPMPSETTKMFNTFLQHTVTIWITDQSGIQMVHISPIAEWSAIQYMIWITYK